MYLVFVCSFEESKSSKIRDVDFFYISTYLVKYTCKQTNLCFKHIVKKLSHASQIQNTRETLFLFKYKQMIQIEIYYIFKNLVCCCCFCLFL